MFSFSRSILKIKRVLRFYFSADSLERAFNNIIIKSALSSARSTEGGLYADKICNLIGEKQELSQLWGYVDGVLKSFSESECAVLEEYANMRTGIKELCEEKRRNIRRIAVKFVRRARRLESFDTALGLVGKYYCLINDSGYLSGR